MFHGDNFLFSNASLQITNAFSDIGRPRRCTLARLGAIDLRAQTQIPSVLRSDTPKQVGAKGQTAPHLAIRSKRASLSYSDFLLQSVHQAVPPEEGAGVALSFRQATDGQEHEYEVRRKW